MPETYTYNFSRLLEADEPEDFDSLTEEEILELMRKNVIDNGVRTKEINHEYYDEIESIKDEYLRKLMHSLHPPEVKRWTLSDEILEHDSFKDILVEIYCNGFDCSVVMSEELTAEQQTELAAVVEDYKGEPDDPVRDLEIERAKRIKEVNSKTDRIIAKGVEFDGHTFSLSLPAQKNWMGSLVAEHESWNTYPYPVSTKDDGEYLIQDVATLKQFSLTVLGAVQVALAEGRALKKLIKAATTLTELDAITDDRDE